MKKLFLLVWVVFLLSVCFANVIFACTDFQIKTIDGTILIGRSMEFTCDVKSQITVASRQEKEIGGSPDGKDGLVWTNKYGYVAINAFGVADVVVDGLNEAGLSVEGLWLPETKYPTVSENQMSSAINIGRLGAWILGNFKTVDEVKIAIKLLRVWAEVVEGIKMEPPIHLAVHDAEGNNIVIEFIAGEIKVYDNPIGVLTNSPAFDWQLTNLRNYTGLTSQNADPLMLKGVTLNPTGQGSGLLGIPGDWTPPSRFVRAAMFVNFADPVADAQNGVSLAAHILNTVDIPYGAIKDKDKNSPLKDSTQWVVIKDLTNKVLYMRDYNNLTLRSIDLKKLSFEPGTKTKKAFLETDEFNIVDITNKFLK